jgi:c-di-GMP-binding flagellar brake protein YcgR
MRYQDKICEGISVDLVVLEGEYQGRYPTRIEEIGERILSVGVPLLGGHFIPLREGTELEIFFADDFSAYSFSSVIINRISYPVPCLIIEYPNRINKVQRRQHVRVRLVKELVYYIMGKEGLSEEKHGFVTDLSGGGLSLKTHEDLPLNTVLLMVIKIENAKIELSGIVTRSRKR